MDIRGCISELLVLHDCVIIPGFGGFIGNYAPARIDPVHHSFIPPGKKLLFNVNLKQNDGLLANFVASAFGISYVDACNRIEEMAEECRFTLKSGKSFVFPAVGHLFQGREGNLQFEQDKTVNLLPDAFGLTPFISPPVGRSTIPLRPERSLAVGESKGRSSRSKVSKTLKWAAALAIPVGIAAVIGVSQFENLNTAQVDNAGILSSVFSRFSSASLVDKKEAPVNAPETYYQQDPAPTIFDNQVPNDDGGVSEPSGDDPALTNTEDTQTLREQPLPATETNESSLSAFNSGDPFAIIVGAFRSKENALKFIAELKSKGTNASIFDRSGGGLYRVTIGTFAIREEAEQLLSSSKSGDFSGAWLLVK